MRHWELDLTHHWQEIHFSTLVLSRQPVGWSFDLQVYLGDIAAEFVQAQLYADAAGGYDARCGRTGFDHLAALTLRRVEHEQGGGGLLTGGE